MITVYTKDFCPFCVQAKKQLSDMGFDYEEINIELNKEAREFLINEGHRTMPQIYYKGKLMVEGGASGLRKMTKEDIEVAVGIKTIYDVVDVSTLQGSL